MLSVAKIAAFVVIVLSVECLIAFLLMPSGQQVQALAESAPHGDAPAAAAPHDAAHGTDHELPEDPIAALQKDHDDAHGHCEEVDLGEYTVTSFQPLSNTTLRIEFHLYVTVPEEEAEAIHKELEHHKHRIREQIIVTLRSAEVTDLTDAGLGLIKRKLTDKINKTLGKPTVKSVIVSDFSFMEH